MARWVSFVLVTLDMVLTAGLGNRVWDFVYLSGDSHRAGSATQQRH